MIHRYNAKYGTLFKEEDIPRLVGDHQLLSNEMDEEKRLALFSEPGFFYLIPPIHGARPAVERLAERFDIVVVTTPWFDPRGYSFNDKLWWLEEHFPMIPKGNVVFTSRKETVCGDILVEDKIKNIAAWKKAWPQGIAASLEYSWTDRNLVDIVEKHWSDLADRILEHR